MRFLMLGFDGLRGDIAEQHGLLRDPSLWRGTYHGSTHKTGWFKVVNFIGIRPVICSTLATVPGWTSVLTGKDPAQHHMLEGKDKYAPHRRRSKLCSFLRTAKLMGKTTAAIGSHGFVALPDGSDKNRCAVGAEDPSDNYKHGWNADTISCTHRFYVQVENKGQGHVSRLDRAIEKQLYEVIDAGVDSIAVVFDGQDQIGHSSGPESDAYGEYIAQEQRPRVERILQKLRETGDEWIVFLTSDHGSHMRSVEPCCFCAGNKGGRHTCFKGDDNIPVFCIGINTDVVNSHEYFLTYCTNSRLELNNHKACCGIANWAMWYGRTDEIGLD